MYRFIMIYRSSICIEKDLEANHHPLLHGHGRTSSLPIYTSPVVVVAQAVGLAHGTVRPWVPLFRGKAFQCSKRDQTIEVGTVASLKPSDESGKRSVLIEEKSLPRGHVPLPCLLEGNHSKHQESHQNHSSSKLCLAVCPKMPPSKTSCRAAPADRARDVTRQGAKAVGPIRSVRPTDRPVVRPVRPVGPPGCEFDSVPTRRPNRWGTHSRSRLQGVLGCVSPD